MRKASGSLLDGLFCDSINYKPGEQERQICRRFDIELMNPRRLISRFGTNLPGIGQLQFSYTTMGQNSMEKILKKSLKSWNIRRLANTPKPILHQIQWNVCEAYECTFKRRFMYMRAV